MVARSFAFAMWADPNNSTSSSTVAIERPLWGAARMGRRHFTRAYTYDNQSAGEIALRKGGEGAGAAVSRSRATTATMVRIGALLFG